MQRILSISAGAAAGLVFARERRARRNAERLAAALLETLLNAVDANDAETGAHVRRVAKSAIILAEAADLDERMQRSVERVALYHDIGKIHEALFDIIHESNKLTPEEYAAVATHAARGAEVLAPLGAFYPDLQEGVLSHHERWDGSGYPRKLKGTDIPLNARIVAIADSFDAITHRRRYKSSRSMDDAVRAIAAGRGTQFDPELVDLFLSPPVLECVERESCEQRPAEVPTATDRRASAGARESVPDVPDVTFRWRHEAPAPLRADLAPRTRPG